MKSVNLCLLRDLLKENVFNGSVFEDSDYIYMRPVISLTSAIAYVEQWLIVNSE